MNEYRVEWCIEVDAENPREAAQRALEIQRDPDSMAVVFDVLDEEGDLHHVDLQEDEE